MSEQHDRDKPRFSDKEVWVKIAPVFWVWGMIAGLLFGEAIWR